MIVASVKTKEGGIMQSGVVSIVINDIDYLPKAGRNVEALEHAALAASRLITDAHAFQIRTGNNVWAKVNDEVPTYYLGGDVYDLKEHTIDSIVEAMVRHGSDSQLSDIHRSIIAGDEQAVAWVRGHDQTWHPLKPQDIVLDRSIMDPEYVADESFGDGYGIVNGFTVWKGDAVVRPETFCSPAWRGKRLEAPVVKG